MTNVQPSIPSSGALLGDETGALVFDLGVNTCRVGFSGEDSPFANVPSYVGELAVTGESGAAGKRFLFEQDINVPRENLEVKPLLNKDGLIDNWDLLEQFFDYSYGKILHSEAEAHPTFFTEPAWNTRACRETLAELMFEKYQVPAYFIAKNPVLSLYAHARHTGVVVDCGAGQTSAVPVFEGFVLQQGIVRSPLGGDFILQESRSYLNNLGVQLMPRYMIAQRHPTFSQDPAAHVDFKIKQNLPKVQQSFHDYQVRQLLQDFAASVLECTDEDDQVMLDQIPTRSYEFPTGLQRQFASERFQLSQSLFDPSSIKRFEGSNVNSMLGVPQTIIHSIQCCDIDIRASLYSSIVPVGGITLIHGFVERLSRVLQSKLTMSARVKIAQNSMHDRRFSTWVGGSILSTLGTFQQMWVSKQEFAETGKTVIDKKCP